MVTKSPAPLNSVASNAKIQEIFRVKRGGNLPYRGWAGTRGTEPFPAGTRNMFGQIFQELGFRVGAEIGVRAGEFSETLVKAQPDLIKHYAIDPWHPYSRTSQPRQDRYLRFAHFRLDPFPCAEFMQMTSMDAVKLFPDQSLDYVYIDGLHDFDNVMMDIIHWVPKIKIGGIVSGHDFKFAFSDGIIQAVEAYTRGHNIQTWYVTPVDDPPSFLWVR